MSATRSTLISRLRRTSSTQSTKPCATARMDTRRRRGFLKRSMPFAARLCARAFRRCRLYLRSEEHTSELQSRSDLVCRLLLEKKKKKKTKNTNKKKKNKKTNHK